ncbi:MAG TPA: hypothetical protein VFZ11_07660 [Gemmatimonadaceae bacterium]
MSELSRGVDTSTVVGRRPVTLFTPPAAGGRVLERRSWRSAATVHGTALLLIGIVPLLAGLALLSVAGGVVAEEIATLRMPRWIAVVVGAMLLCAGVAFALHGWRGVRSARRARRARASYPDQPWLWDHPWNAFAAFDETRDELRRGIPAVVMLAAFLLPFNWIAFSRSDGHWVVGIVTGAFDALLVLAVARLVYLAHRAGRHGTTELRLPRFPCLTGSDVELKLLRTPALAAVGALRATLRCVEERYEVRGAGRQRRPELVAYALHESRAGGEVTPEGDAIVFRFAVPADASGSSLSERPPRYWELAVEGEAPEAAYGATFLLPIYARSA